MNILAMIQNSDVDWKALGEVCSFQNGFAFKSNLFTEKGLPIIRIANIDGIKVNLDSLKYFNPSNYKENLSFYRIRKGDILIAMSGATTGKIGYYNLEEESYLNQRVGKFVPNERFLNNRYLYHYLLSQTEQLYIMAGGGAQANLSSNKLMSGLKIPIPPLAVQEKIVQILDNFTELTTELTTREKQYAYYREKLLNFDDQAETIEWRALKEITLQTHNIKWQKKQETYQYIDLTSVNRENHTIEETIEISAANAPSRAQKIVEEEDVIFATTRPTQQRVTLVNNEYSGAIASTGYCVLRANKNVVLPKWIYFNTLSETFKKYLEENQSGSAYPAISDTKLKEFGIPIPPLAEQNRIVAIPDKFDALTHSITEGLPREIELRQKQYEYYRNLLLSFPKPENKL